MELHTLHCFAGAGGGILADIILGHVPIGAIEIESYPREVLLRRQLDGQLPRFPIWDDVQTFRRDNEETKGFIERLISIKDRLLISGGSPCQDISSAGKGEGITGKKSGLWKEMARIIDEVRPRFVFVENSPMLVSRGLDVVVEDLAKSGFDAAWCIVGADEVGAPHIRKRIWILGWDRSFSDSARIQSGRKIKRSQRQRIGAICESDHVPSSAGIGCESRRTERKEQRWIAETSSSRNNFSESDGKRAWVEESGDSGFGREESRVAERTMVLQKDGKTCSEIAGASGEEVSDADSNRCGQMEQSEFIGKETEETTDQTQYISRSRRWQWWLTEPIVGRMVDGVASRLDIHGANAYGGVDRLARSVPNRVQRLKAIGNGQVAMVAAAAFSILMRLRDEIISEKK